ncbi:MAG: 50S ribosomal protein L29 [Candidatus Curtissbacteria bacterium]|nr:50S ribosomal protein L29 [Candidatus Curtissbacteria bacterium]
MKKNEFDSLKNKTVDDLKKTIQDFRKEVANTQLETRMGKVKNVHMANSKRKEIAIAKTILSAKISADKVAKEDKNATS